MKKPESFKGDRGNAAENFMLQMELYFRAYRRHFTDEIKITTFLMNLKDKAAQWARTRLRKVESGDFTGELASWVTFKQAFEKHFGEVLKEEKYAAKLDKLMQTKAAKDYVNMFQELAEELPDNELTLIRKFKKGLKDNVRQAAVQAEIHHPTRLWTLQDWYDFAIRTDDILFESNKERNKDNNRSKEHTTKRAETGKAGTDNRSSETPKKRDKNSPGWVDQKTVDKRMKEQRCIKCGKPGHRISDCRSKIWIPEKEDKVKGKKAETAHISEPEDEGSDEESTVSEN